MTKHYDPAYDMDSPKAKAKSFGRWVAEWVVILVLAAVFTVLMRTYVFQTFYIPSASMENTLLIGDKLVVNKLAYKTGDLHHGDIIVFKRPPREADPQLKDLIKRVIGLPGDKVESRNGDVYVNDQPINEPYLKFPHSTEGLASQTVPAGEVLVLGDNRTNSSDGRVFGTFSQNLIEGRATLRYWPSDRMGKLTN